MCHAVEIYILEVFKSKKYYMLIFDLEMLIPFVNGVKLLIFGLGNTTFVSNFNYFLRILVFFGKTEGGLDV